MMERDWKWGIAPELNPGSAASAVLYSPANKQDQPRDYRFAISCIIQSPCSQSVDPVLIDESVLIYRPHFGLCQPSL
jgi:hypothetical protein